MKSLDYHPHLVCMLGVSIDSNHGKLLLIEYCDQGDLLHLVRSKKDEIIKVIIPIDFKKTISKKQFALRKMSLKLLESIFQIEALTIINNTILVSGT